MSCLGAFPKAIACSLFLAFFAFPLTAQMSHADQVQIAPPLGGAAAGDRPSGLILGLAVGALTLTAVNMFGGFAVTRRMLAMFRK